MERYRSLIYFVTQFMVGLGINGSKLIVILKTCARNLMKYSTMFSDKLVRWLMDTFPPFSYSVGQKL
jgi:hypothetical protein